MGVRQSATIVFSDNDDDIGDEKGRRKKRRKKGKVSLFEKHIDTILTIHQFTFFGNARLRSTVLKESSRTPFDRLPPPRKST